MHFLSAYLHCALRISIACCCTVHARRYSRALQSANRVCISVKKVCPRGPHASGHDSISKTQTQSQSEILMLTRNCLNEIPVLLPLTHPSRRVLRMCISMCFTIRRILYLRHALQKPSQCGAGEHGARMATKYHWMV